MNYLDIAGIKQGVETDIETILPNRARIEEVFKAAVESCYEHGTSLPSNLKAKGELMLHKPASARALMHARARRRRRTRSSARGRSTEPR